MLWWASRIDSISRAGLVSIIGIGCHSCPRGRISYLNSSDLLFQMLTDSGIIYQLIYEFMVIVLVKEYTLQVLRKLSGYLLVSMMRA